MSELGKLKLEDGFYQVIDGVIYALKIDIQENKSIRIPIAPDDELQHVAYDDAQLGREK